ncbi:MAG: 1,4-dihydroxy-2-naphthoate polyprenyltransferase [Propionibacteriaceae bacterium]|nr:1,4-dihydroxy-2-naphthoate polyprenyltransferase [Propionibacteriaceae bacterium]
MASVAQWVEGARPRTLPAATAPVIAGSAIAWFHGQFDGVLAALALVVALGLQVGVNYANDYSDGIRGTDAARVGPMRLVGSGAAEPSAVLAAALTSFGVAAVAGVAIVVITGHWWLLLVGAAAVAAAWFYTGGSHPYGYLGLGELFVFIFFGLVAVTGTVYIQTGTLTATTWWTAIAIGALACAILVANNLRDIDGDRAAGKRTLATRLGDRGTRWFFLGLLGVAAVGVIAVAATSSWWALLGLIMGVALVGPVREVLRGVSGLRLIPVLKRAGLAELLCAAGIFIGLLIAR